MKNNFNPANIKPQQIAPGLLPGIKSTDLKGVYCKHCNNTRFIPICELKLANRFQTAVSQPMLVSFQGGYACSSCGKINELYFEGEESQEKPNTNEDHVKN